MKRVNNSILFFAALIQAAVSQGGNFVQDTTVDLSSKILKSVSAENGAEKNIAFAPFSIAIGLGMLYEGLAGKTRLDASNALGFPNDDSLFRSGFTSSIPDSSDTNVTTYANMIVIENTSQVKNDFGVAMTEVFKANPFRHDFALKPQVAMRSVNGWVKMHSNGKIKDLMPPGSITSNTKVVLVNVIHFKADWEEKFKDVFPAEFTLATGEKKDVDTMYTTLRNVGYSQLSNGAELARLDFADGDHSMVLLIPSKESNIQAQIETLDENTFNTIANPDSLPNTEAVVQMPKFEIDQRLELKKILLDSYPGIRDIFSTRGDFSRIAENTAGFAVDEIHHKAVVEVNESGVEATGATGIAIVLKSGFFPETEIIADRPFAYFIVDKKNRNILFAGVLNEP